jgi:hypothetical protein
LTPTSDYRYPPFEMKSALFYLSVALLLVGGAAAEPAVEEVGWRGLKAFRLSDGRTEAVVVPQLGGRVVSYGLIGGFNWLWNGLPGSELKEPPLFWGGDKTYIGPHTMWNFTLPSTWPPPLPDRAAHEVVAKSGVLFATRSPDWPGYGAAVEREYSFDAQGDLVIKHTIGKAPGSQALGAVWVITQIAPPESVFVPLNPVSPYKENFFRFAWSKELKGSAVLSTSLLELKPVPGIAYKLGAHPAKPALAAVRQGLVFLVRADAQSGQYPEGADGAGLSVEVYHHDLPGAGEYFELEPHSALRRMDQGATLTTRWSIQRLESAEVASEVERLLGR